MTLFDVIVVLILAASAIVGLIRGFLREVMTVFAVVLAAVVAIFALRFTGPIARRAIDPEWAGNAAALLIVFVFAYILIRVLGGGLSGRVKKMQTLGLLDRVGGVAFGLARGLVMLGLFHLVFHAVTPLVRVPQWISGSALYPLSETCAKALRRLAPEGSAVADRLAPHLEQAVRDGSRDEAPSSGTPQTVEKRR